MTVTERMELRDIARQAALNFAGQRISSADGTYELLINVIFDAMNESAEAEREACKQIAKDFREEVAGASCGVEFYQTACSVIYERISNRGR